MRVLWLVFVLAACSPPEPASGEPQRIASLLPAWTEIVVALGAGDRLIACSEYCEPGRELPRIDWRAPRSAERLARLGPDLVLKQKPRAPHDPLRAALRSTGIRVATSREKQSCDSGVFPGDGSVETTSPTSPIADDSSARPSSKLASSRFASTPLALISPAP